MKGFFSSTPTRQPIPLLPQCGLCGIYKHCHSPKMKVDGQGRRKILIIGEAPGFSEDSKGIPFCGKSGQLVIDTLRKFGVEMRRDCWVTNALICHPHEGGKNRTPTDKEVSYCRPNVIRAIKELKPHTIILLGGQAVKSVIGWLWKEDVGLVSRWDGYQIPSQRINAWVCPTWHPAWILRSDDKSNDVRKMFFEQHLKAACKLEGKPWEKVPDWKAEVLVEFDTDKAAKIILNLFNPCITNIAIDYETTTLKPDSKDARIYSCALSNGESTIAYPWHGKSIKATEQLLMSNIPKIASNLKFEERWTMKEFGRGVNNWQWDTMLAAHVLNNRPGTTSIKFQAFIELGVDVWDDLKKPYFKTDNSNSKNRINEADLKEVLTYNALDSLFEWHVAQRQMKRMKYDPQ